MAMVLEQLPKPAELDDDVFAGENLQNPYPFYEKLRDAGPVVKFKKWDSYALARHKELKQALTDWESFTSSAGVGLGNIKKGETWRSPSALVEVDPPAHTKIRSALQKIISPVVVRGWRQQFEAVAETYVTEKIAQIYDSATAAGERGSRSHSMTSRRTHRNRRRW